MRNFALLAVLLGCATEDENLVEVEQDGTSLNGTSLNGTSLNGTSLNGTSLNGTSLTGAQLTAASTTAAPLTGSTVVGSTWTGTASNGTSVKLRVDSAERGTGANSDLWFYGVSYQTATGWTSLCGADKAVTVAGTWNASATYAPSTTQFTFACRGKTIAKCVELGYKTYKGYTNQLASCVRLLRGDFCGTGVSYTVDGTLLNVYDNVGVQADTQALWLVEAEWSPTGARCVGNVVTTRFLERKLTLPPCVLSLVSLSCGKFRTGTYLVDELPLL